MDLSNSDLFKSINNDNDDNISLAGSVISAYDNSINNNIDDLISILKNGSGQSNKKHSKKSCVLQTVKESSITPDDSISQIGGNYNLNNIDDDDDDINNHINMFSTALQQKNNIQTSPKMSDKSTVSYSKSIFDTPSSNIIKQENIFDINKNKIQQPEVNFSNTNTEQYTGGAPFSMKKNENFHMIILIALSSIFCYLSYSSPGNTYLNAMGYGIIFCVILYFMYGKYKSK